MRTNPSPGEEADARKRSDGLTTECALHRARINQRLRRDDRPELDGRGRFWLFSLAHVAPLPLEVVYLMCVTLFHRDPAVNFSPFGEWRVTGLSRGIRTFTL
jgi:hypothetical protein